ncbi:RNA polymerase sigma factor SigY [Marinicrinis lubricantis]|uniref:RNA polymerase sigma factor SigY n=1 Tax=Marinicrinis lubricantis TaxID=2086470 RepID=A0ABW1ITP9_9BACL
MTVDDTDLISKARKGDRTALAQLLHKHYGFMLHYFMKITMNRMLAEDLAQDTALRAMEKLHQFDERRSKFSSWMMTIGTRLYLDSLRRKKRELRWQEQEQAIRKLRWEVETRGSEWPEILEALSLLQEDTRLSVILKHYYGYTYEEIGEMLKLPAGTVKSKIHNGLKWLRKEMAADEAKQSFKS